MIQCYLRRPTILSLELRGAWQEQEKTKKPCIQAFSREKSKLIESRIVKKSTFFPLRFKRKTSIKKAQNSPSNIKTELSRPNINAKTQIKMDCKKVDFFTWGQQWIER
jgi:hypothetical protein